MKVVALTGLTFFLVFSVFACTCTVHNSIETEFTRSDLVFVGKVISHNVVVQPDTVKFSDEPGDYYVQELSHTKYVMKISTLFKGKVAGKEVEVLTHSQLSMCGVKLKPDTAYIIYAVGSIHYAGVKDGGNYFFYTDSCFRTGEKNDGEVAELVRLMEPQVED